MRLAVLKTLHEDIRGVGCVHVYAMAVNPGKCRIYEDTNRFIRLVLDDGSESVLSMTFDEAVTEINNALNWETRTIARALGPQHVPAPVYGANGVENVPL